MPSPGDEAMLYQMIIGAWPVDTTDVGDYATGWPSGSSRRCARRSWRRTGTRRTWTMRTRPGRSFMAIMADADGFAGEAAEFARRIGPAGAVNGLAQTLLKLTVPGVPDFYQGTEFWDQCLVDPDNRRPVDFARGSTHWRPITPVALAKLAGREGEAGGDPPGVGAAPQGPGPVRTRRVSARRGDRC